MNVLKTLFFLMITAFSGVFAQELNCKVNIITNSNKLPLSTTDLEVLKQLEQTIYDIMNSTQWTKEKFKIEERINCNLQLEIKTIISAGKYSGALQVQSSRPAFNSEYNTTMFNFVDEDVEFTYDRNSIMVFSPNQFNDNLTSILAFYAYFIIGMDYDSFSLKGGTAYFNQAQQIVQNAQTSGYTGWSSSQSGAAGKKNRFYLVDNVLQQFFEPLRECNYQYHRNGIDKLYDNMDEARKAIYSALNLLMKVSATRPNSINVLNFVQAKSNELKNLFMNAEVKDKTAVVDLLKKLDPANSQKYQQILG